MLLKDMNSAMKSCEDSCPEVDGHVVDLGNALEFAVAGLGYYAPYGSEIWRRLYLGMHVELRCEPDNEHDAYAVAVHAGSGHKIGYVPRGINVAVFNVLRAKGNVVARISHLRHLCDVRERVYVKAVIKQVEHSEDSMVCEAEGNYGTRDCDTVFGSEPSAHRGMTCADDCWFDD